MVAEVPLRCVHHPGCGPLHPPQLLAIQPSGEQPMAPGTDGDAERVTSASSARIVATPPGSVDIV